MPNGQFCNPVIIPYWLVNMLQFVVYVGVIIVCAVVAVLYLYPVSIIHAVIRCGEDRVHYEAKF